MKKKEALEKAIDICGGQVEFARLLSKRSKRKILQQNVSYWLNKPGELPVDMVLIAEKLCDGAITRHDFQPKIYPRERAPL